MRFDSLGLFWKDVPQPKDRRVPPARTPPPIPATGWAPPRDFPNLSAAKIISFDCETKDPNLLSKGPGSIRRDGHIVGIAIGTDDGGRWYFPMRHTVQPELNLDPDTVLRWAASALSTPALKVGANVLYDLEWLASEGVSVAGPFYDVQIAEPLLDEYRKSYSLNNLAIKYLNAHKTEAALYSWCASAYGGQAERAQAANIYRAPPSLVGPYAEGDVDLPLHIMVAQKKALAASGLESLCDLEHALIPLLLAMRRRGVRVNQAAASTLHESFSESFTALHNKWNIDCWAASDIARQCDALGVNYPMTVTKKPSFTAQWLADHDHEFLRDIGTMRKLDKLRGTFLGGGMLEHAVNGRVHTQFHQLRSDVTGTVSGRFSSSNPNLQNIPARDPVIGPLIRNLFLPEEGEQWYKFDYSQIEPRLQLHYSQGVFAERQRQKLRETPTLSCYKAMMADMKGIDVTYAQFKSIWLGISYGMGVAKMAASLGVTKAQAKEYRRLFPNYILRLFETAQRTAANRGHIRTLLGRRARFPWWESNDFDCAKRDGTMPCEEATARYGEQIKRAHTHKALNRLAQGGAADILKKAMVDIWKSGACNILGAPLLTVHDELDWSVPVTPEAQEALREVRRIMETCVTLQVPLQVAVEVGDSWGDLKAVAL